MQSKSVTPYEHQVQPRISWGMAYRRFLLSRDENLLLKAAPLAMVGILPFELLSNLIPIVGELDDIGYVIIMGYIFLRTMERVNKYRQVPERTSR